jgi:hypothetical protein
MNITVTYLSPIALHANIRLGRIKFVRKSLIDFVNARLKANLDFRFHIRLVRLKKEKIHHVLTNALAQCEICPSIKGGKKFFNMPQKLLSLYLSLWENNVCPRQAPLIHSHIVTSSHLNWSENVRLGWKYLTKPTFKIILEEFQEIWWVRVKQHMRSPLMPTYFPRFRWISVSVLLAGWEGVIIC